MSIENNEVFEAIRRGYSDLSIATDKEILDYFDSIDDNSIIGHVSNIKGILFEQEYIGKLSELGIKASMFEYTNHPDTDIQIFQDGEIFQELQLKATDSSSYINHALLDNPEISIVATTEIASTTTNDLIIDSGISNFLLEEMILELLFPATPINIFLEGLENGFDALFFNTN